jgi:acyl-coenzyme A thioesterase PaaI-like protein
MAESIEEEKHSLKTHLKFEGNPLFGEIQNIGEDTLKATLKIRHDMKADRDGLIHNGYIYSSASFIAAATVNHKFGFVIASQVNFLTPVREGDLIEFEAHTEQQNGKKRIVDIVGKIGDVKVFIGEFTVAVMERHILSVDLDEVETEIRKKNNKDDE